MPGRLQLAMNCCVQTFYPPLCHHHEGQLGHHDLQEGEACQIALAIRKHLQLRSASTPLSTDSQGQPMMLGIISGRLEHLQGTSGTRACFVGEVMPNTGQQPWRRLPMVQLDLQHEADVLACCPVVRQELCAVRLTKPRDARTHHQLC